MKLYLVNAENIYFSQTKEYFREIVSSYDNGNYRSAMVMLYSTIVCDLLLKLKELSEVYNDQKAENLLAEINAERKQAGNSSWEWKLIKAIREKTELLSDESYAMIDHIYDLRNFSAHPALTEDYELISPSAEMTVAYIKKALDDIFVKPSVFAQNIIDRMSDDIAARKEQYQNDFEAFEQYLDKVYFQRMSSKMINQVFRAFWKFTFKKYEGDDFKKNRFINRRTIEAMLNKHYLELCEYICQDQAFFTIAANSNCTGSATILCAYFPQVYYSLDETVKHQLREFKEQNVEIIQWFISGDIENHLANLEIKADSFHKNIFVILEKICRKQGKPELFRRFLIKHYSQSKTYNSAKNRFDNIIEPNLHKFSKEDFVLLIQAINENNQIYNYCFQQSRNDRLLDVARPVLPKDFDYSIYENFVYTEVPIENGKTDEDEELEETEFETPLNCELPF